MRSPALALTGTVWRRYRWGLAVCAAVWLLLTVLGLLLPRGTWTPGPAGEPIAPVAITVLGLFIPSLAFVFYAFSGINAETPLEARESGFPTRTFTLPVSTFTLVLWPMVQGSAAVALTWIAWVGAVLRPAGLDAPLVWPALLSAALLAWLQAIAWRAFPFHFFRIIVTAGTLAMIAMAPSFALALKTPPALLAIALALVVPAAYVAAVVGVARARRGDVPTWSWPSRLFQPLSLGSPRMGATFASPLQAQTWFEWRMRGLAFPLTTVLVLCPWAVVVFTGMAEKTIDVLVATNEPRFVALAANALSVPGLLAVLLLANIPLLAAVSGAEFGGMRYVGQKMPGVAFTCHPFLAVRPLTDAAFVAAKLRMAARSALAGWAPIVLTVSLWLGLTGEWRVLAAAPLLQPYGAVELCGLLAAGLVALILLTWLLLVASLWIGLTGRRWLTFALSGATAVVSGPLGLAAYWLAGRPDIQTDLAAAFPYIAAGALTAKLLLAGWLALVLWQLSLVPPRALAAGAVTWFIAAAGVVAALGIFTSWRASFAAVALWVVLLLPLNRFAVAPLALAWNRHR